MGAAQRLPDQFTEPGTGRRINLLDYQAANKRDSWLVALFTVGLLVGIAYLMALAIDPGAAAFFIGAGLLIGAGQSVVGFWFSDKIALAAAGARPATVEEHRYLVNVAEAVAIGAGVPMPKVYVIDSPAPNAFATGRNPENSAIAVTTGLIQLLDRQELEGVVAHEMAHIRNYDVRFMSMLVATLGAIVVLRDMLLRGFHLGGGRSSRRSSNNGGGKGQGVAMILLLVLLILAPLLGAFARMAVSRKREYLADAVGAFITRNPDGLANALAKLGSYSGQRLEVGEAVRSMFVVNPVLRLNANGLFATHPPIEERIRRLRRM